MQNIATVLPRELKVNQIKTYHLDCSKANDNFTKSCGKENVLKTIIVDTLVL